MTSTDVAGDPSKDYVRSWLGSEPQWFYRPDGTKLRFVVAGQGAPVLLLHTVRTQLDYFQRVIPLLSSAHRVYSLDFPGMGWSDIRPGASYNHDQMRSAVVDFVRGNGLSDLTLAGESMGATIALTASVSLGSLVRRVVASNTYDYPQGVERSNLLARMIIPAVKAPLVGTTFAALENRAIIKGIMNGGYANPSKFPDEFLSELVRVGKRRGYPGVARAVYRSLPTYIAARAEYAAVSVPVTLLYSQHDWSRTSDRTATAAALPTASVRNIADAGHFAAMEKPHALADAILGQ
ncbi:alpha/beta fold hydrolase [Mycobacterium paraterrae]|uniref:Alpha/beta hydrolase n=1 Tax=Mycobacterium paraterrae TaxID=577492 RepID=A0ABY3VKZ1_9MYCO|nr:alpha/beta hydrolase [Mycobacterium paraterrae]UMB67892.1 alpha/beta hydrolase [Mycobacterium paraterrae]